MFEPVMNAFKALMDSGETERARSLARMQHFRLGSAECDFVAQMIKNPDDVGPDDPYFPAMPYDTMPPAQDMSLAFGMTCPDFFSLSLVPGTMEVVVTEWRGPRSAQLGFYKAQNSDRILIGANYPSDWVLNGDLETEQSIMMAYIVHAIALINQPRIVLKVKASTRADRRRADKEMGRIGPAAWFDVVWNIGAPVRARAGNTIDDYHGVALHFRRAHWRQAKQGQPKAQARPEARGFWCWVHECWAGHPAFGIRLHHYSPKLTEAAASKTALALSKTEALRAAGYL